MADTITNPLDPYAIGQALGTAIKSQLGTDTSGTGTLQQQATDLGNSLQGALSNLNNTNNQNLANANAQAAATANKTVVMVAMVVGLGLVAFWLMKRK